MYHHIVAYSESVAAVTNEDINAAVDNVLQVRNNHIILSERYNLLAAYPFGASMSRARFGNVALTRIGTQHLWPVNVGATVPSRPVLMDRRDRPLKLPMNEEITLEITSTAAGPAQHGALLWLGTSQWTRTLPQGLDRLTTRATAVMAAGSETTWSTPVTLVMERDLFNGVYAVVGANVVAAGAMAFRLNFLNQKEVGGRQLRPGGLTNESATDLPEPSFMGGWGVWGKFSTFEPPQLSLFADAAGLTAEVRLDLVYLGENLALLRGE